MPVTKVKKLFTTVENVQAVRYWMNDKKRWSNWEQPGNHLVVLTLDGPQVNT